MADKKSLPFALMQILTKYTDNRHVLSSKDIIRILSSEYGLSCERRTIYANIELLIKFGYGISTFQENGQGYFLREHQFSVTEIVAMFESMQGSEQLSADEQRLLRNKLLSTLSDSQKRTFQNA